jgi:outer membrane protein assembly factor BamD (BamD/ComL family)
MSPAVTPDYPRGFANEETMKKFMNVSMIAAVLSAALFFVGCQSVPEEVPQGISQQEFFQRAQEYTDELNYEAALFYLREFKVRYPDDQYNHLAADYQIALISYKQNRFEEAEAQFQGIIDTYSAAAPGTYPEWVDVLSRKLLEKIREDA